jgi:hypothetical protein
MCMARHVCVWGGGGGVSLRGHVLRQVCRGAAPRNELCDGGGPWLLIALCRVIQVHATEQLHVWCSSAHVVYGGHNGLANSSLGQQLAGARDAAAVVGMALQAPLSLAGGEVLVAGGEVLVAGGEVLVAGLCS